jgi:PKD domain
MKNFVMAVIVLLTCQCYAQKHDYVWLKGGGLDLNLYPSLGSTEVIKSSFFDFNNDTLLFYERDSFNVMINGATYSNKSGELMVHSSCGQLYNKYGNIVSGTEWFGIDSSFIQPCCYISENEYLPSAVNLTNSIFFIPLDNSDDRIGIIQSYIVPADFARSTQLQIGILIVDSLGELSLEKKQLPLPYQNYTDINNADHKFAPPILNRHANGKDWWCLIPGDESSNVVEKVLITADTTIYMGQTFLLETMVENQLPELIDMQGVFTQNGDQLIIKSVSNGIYVLDFDRCTGNLTYNGQGIKKQFYQYEPLANYELLAMQIGYSVTNLIVDDTDRFVYITLGGAIVRFDKDAIDFATSEDTIFFLPEIFEPVESSSRLVSFALGPDGKIYIFNNAAGFAYVLENPSEPIVGNLIFTRITQPMEPDSLVARWRLWQNFPHYRLGPIDGSPCDTLGINNDPLAAWNYTKYDTIQHIVQFWDLTDYEPTYWYWDFGDGDTSTIQNPQHQYDKGGAYWVCLIVGNANSVDTLCKWVYLPLGTSSNDVNLDWPVSVYPNPTTSHQVTVVLPATALGDNTFALYDMQGRLVLSTGLTNGRNAVDLGQLSQAHYAYAIRDAMGVVRANGILDVGR